MNNGKTRRAFGVAKHLSAITLVLGALGAAQGCNSIDTTRIAPPKATLGDDLFGLMCDRVGASSFTEDLSGGSYYGICHYDDSGNYKDALDTSYLPPVSEDAQVRARNLSTAKMMAMARRRSDLIRAFNTAFPDTMIDDAVQGSGQVRFHDALLDMTQRLEPLYTSNPYDPNGAPLMPASTRAMGKLFRSIADSQPAREALARIWGRQGYRPFQVGLGAIRPALAYTGLREMTKASLEVLGPNGVAAPELEQLLNVSKYELLTSFPNLSPLPPLSVDTSKGQPNRPRSNLEVLAKILLSQDKTYAVNDQEAPRYIVLRDRRGFAVPLGNTPGLVGTVNAPFADVDGDGFADVDAFGRFIDGQMAPVAVDPPFAIPGITMDPPDPFGRPSNAPYTYLDTSRALTGALTRHFVPLLDPTQYAMPGDPNAWQTEHETIMYAMAGANVLFGGREPAQYDYPNEAILPGDQGCDGCVPYTRFRAEDSPFVDLAHAAGQIFGDKDSDAVMLSFIDLLENHEDVVARLVGALLKVRDISLKHDQASQAGKEPFASLTYETPIWDEMAQIIARLTARPGLVRQLVESLAQDDVVTPHGSSKHMGETTAVFATTVDKMTYDQNNQNGPAVNLTVGAPATDDPKTPIQPNAPRKGDNISLLQRSLMVIHDASRATACNKQGAKVDASILGLTVQWPLFGSYNECELVSFDNEATFYLDANLPINHPKRSQMKLKGTLNDIINFLGAFTNPDNLFISSSGIDGLGLHPEPYALNRLLFFGATTDNFPGMADHDFVNEGGQTDNFIHDLIEPAGGISCPRDANNVNYCNGNSDTLRIRDGNTMFAWERLGFLEYMKPLILTFANQACDAQGNCNVDDVSGEQIFVDLIDELSYHWPGKDHGSECNKNGTKDTNHKYCSEAGINRYEPLLGDALRTDLIPALHEFAKAARDLSNITVQRGPHAGEVWSGAEVLERLTRILFDQTYAKSVGMVDRNGNASAKWVDGTKQDQLTPFTLFCDALHEMDVRFDNGPDDKEVRRGQWHRARSQFVDELLSVEGEGPGAKFHNRSFAKMTVAILKTLREQINANCPDRETTGQCTWARHDLGDKLRTVMSGPVFAAIMDVQEATRADENSRRQLEAFLQYVMQAASSGDALQATLASMSDLMQLLSDDGNFSPIFNAISNVSDPEADPDGPGMTDTTIKTLKALSGDDYDRYHVLDYILPNLVTPMDGTNLSPIEILMDTIAEIDRIDSSSQDPLNPDDYGVIMGSLRDFMLDDTRGLEQVYTIMKNRPAE